MPKTHVFRRQDFFSSNNLSTHLMLVLASPKKALPLSICGGLTSTWNSSMVHVIHFFSARCMARQMNHPPLLPKASPKLDKGQWHMGQHGGCHHACIIWENPSLDFLAHQTGAQVVEVLCQPEWGHQAFPEGPRYGWYSGVCFKIFNPTIRNLAPACRSFSDWDPMQNDNQFTLITTYTS